MGRNKVSAELKRISVRLSRVFPIPIVAILLEISDDTVRRAVQLHEVSGDILPIPTGAPRGRRPILTEEDRQVRSTP